MKIQKTHQRRRNPFQFVLVLGIFILGIASSGLGQDIVYRLDGTMVEAKVLMVSEDIVNFKRYNNLEGPTYSERRSSLIKITYEKGGEDIFNTVAAKKIESRQNANTGNDQKLDLSNRHFVYGELFGFGGIVSVNYEKKLTTLAEGHVFVYARVGMGFSNGGLYFPHAINLGFGNEKHQFELGANATIATRFSEGDAWNFLHGDGLLRYTFGPSLGYRYQSTSGYFSSIAIPLIISKDTYYFGSNRNFDSQTGTFTRPPRWGMTPWMRASFGFSF